MKNSFKETCIKLREKDYTLNEIVKLTRRPKTSVFFHISQIPLSKNKQEAILKNRISRINKYSSSIKGKSLKKFKKIRKFNKRSVSLLSHLLFDGQIIRSGCVYHNRSEVLIKQIVDDMRSFYQYDPAVTKSDETGVVKVSYFNVALAIHFKEKAAELLGTITNLNLNLKKVFLRSFFDDEGSVYYSIKNNEKRVRGYQQNKNILILIQNLLKNFDIESSVSKKHPEITISGRQNLEKFAREIDFSKGVRVNGKRKNSIWKKDLEKREILKMALDSYKAQTLDKIQKTSNLKAGIHFH